ncbi:phosphoadenosine phosphosulfate reductase [Vibrio phage K250 g1]
MVNSNKKVVSFSGGRTSAYLCYLMKEKYGDDVDFVYMDTGAEHPKTYDFIRNVNDAFGLNLTCLRTKFNPELGKANSYEVISIDEIKHDLKPWVEMMKKYGTPYNPGGAFCTDRMKLVPWTKYLNEKYGKGCYSTYLGIRIDEPKRLKPRDGIVYLGDISDFEKQDILDWWSEQDFNLEIEEHLGNCVFCIKKGINKVALAIKDEPELADRFNEILDVNEIRTVEKRKSPPLEMYRGRQSFGQIIATFKEHSRDEIASTIRGMKSYNSGSCSESCEVFICESNQGDLFDA